MTGRISFGSFLDVFYLLLLVQELLAVFGAFVQELIFLILLRELFCIQLQISLKNNHQKN